MGIFGIFQNKTTKVFNLADVNKDGKIDKKDLEDEKCEALNKSILEELGVTSGNTFDNKAEFKSYIEDNEVDVKELLNDAKEKASKMQGTKPSMGLGDSDDNDDSDTATVGSSDTSRSGNSNNTVAASNSNSDIAAGLQAEVAAGRITTKEQAEVYIKAHGGELTSENELKTKGNKETFYPSNIQNAEMKEAFELWKNANSDEEFNNKMTQMQSEGKGHYASNTVNAAKIREMIAKADPDISKMMLGYTKEDIDKMSDSELLQKYYEKLTSPEGSNISFVAADYDKSKGEIRMLYPVMAHMD